MNLTSTSKRLRPLFVLLLGTSVFNIEACQRANDGTNDAAEAKVPLGSSDATAASTAKALDDLSSYQSTVIQSILSYQISDDDQAGQRTITLENQDAPTQLDVNGFSDMTFNIPLFSFGEDKAPLQFKILDGNERVIAIGSVKAISGPFDSATNQGHSQMTIDRLSLGSTYNTSVLKYRITGPLKGTPPARDDAQARQPSYTATALWRLPVETAKDSEKTAVKDGHYPVERMPALEVLAAQPDQMGFDSQGFYLDPESANTVVIPAAESITRDHFTDVFVRMDRPNTLTFLASWTIYQTVFAAGFGDKEKPELRQSLQKLTRPVASFYLISKGEPHEAQRIQNGILDCTQVHSFANGGSNYSEPIREGGYGDLPDDTASILIQLRFYDYPSERRFNFADFALYGSGQPAPAKLGIVTCDEDKPLARVSLNAAPTELP